MTVNRTKLWACIVLGFLPVGFSEISATAAEPEIHFRKVQLDGRFRSEGVAIADFNQDGQNDIAAGMVWYEAPKWEMHLLGDTAPEHDPKGYSNSFCNFADDFNGDGWPDLLIVGFPGAATNWFENPHETGKPWKQHLCTSVTNNESPQYLDLNGDGKRELLMGVASDPAQPDAQAKMAYVTPAKDPNAAWDVHAISAPGAPGTQRYAHGLGAGDVNGDGKWDVLCSDGWWAAPSNSEAVEWKFYPVPFGGCAHMFAYDLDGDGDNDVINSSPHAYGVWWHEQLPDGQWKKNLIDDTFSQTHAVCLADINGDGLMDFVTGKRWWAHASGDPGVDEPAVFHWFELKREKGVPSWIRHQFDHDSGPGTQFEVCDVNRDGLLDIVASNKKGVHYFEQERK